MNSLPPGESPPLDLGSVLDCLPDPMIIIGPDYRIVASNRAYCAQFYGKTSAVGRRCHEVSHRRVARSLGR